MTDRAASGEEDEARALAHPLTNFGFDTLVAGAARPRPGALACRDEVGGIAEVLTFADLCQRVGACLEQLRGLGFAPGERAILCCPPSAHGFVVLTAALAARIDPVLAPLPSQATRATVAAAAKRVSATAIFAPAQYCGMDFGRALIDIAARTPSIRVIGTLGGALEGALDISPRALAAQRGERSRLTESWNGNQSARVGALDERGEVHFVSQGTLVGAALDLVRATRQQEQGPILSLLAPNTPGALVAGPLAALISGAPLHFLAPFASGRFREMLAELGPVRLVAPASALTHLGRAGLLHNGAFVGVVAVTAEPVDPIDAACPVAMLREATGTIDIGAASPAHASRHAAIG